MRTGFRFGIPHLDHILNAQDLYGPHSGGPEWAASSATILGPDGTGKSVFSLHVASTYLSDAIRQVVDSQTGQPWWVNTPKANVAKLETKFFRDMFPPTGPSDGAAQLPKVIYVSTDLRYERARDVWENFWLDFPWNRHLPFDFKPEIDFRRRHVKSPIRIGLENLSPQNACALEEYFRPVNYRSDSDPAGSRVPRERCFSIGFLDLATHTAGDDWDLILRIVSGVRKKPKAPPNLLILDSVAGFETLAGELNAYGQAISRRARLAQLIRAAGQDWSLVLVVEEPKPGEHSPEEFVTDMVLRLRREGTGEHARRTLEIEKARAASYGIGEHPFEIRDGEGTSTGSWQNADDPRASIHADVQNSLKRFGVQMAENRQKYTSTSRWPFNAYVQVFQSLHFRSHQFSKKVNLGSVDDGSAINRPHLGFGIPYLDNLLSDGDRPEALGLAAGTVTALIGDESTRKSLLAQTFIRNGYRGLPDLLTAVRRLAADLIEDVKRPSSVEGIVQRTPGLDLCPQGEISNQKVTGSETLRDLFLRHWKTSLESNPDIGGWFLNICRGKTTLRSLTGDTLGRALATRERPDVYVEAPATRAQGDREVAIICTILREIPGILMPTVLITTEDIRAETIADELLELHKDGIQAALSCGADGPTWRYAKQHLSRALERVLLVRRVELHDATTPQIFHVIEENILTSLEVLFPGQVDRTDIAPRPGAGLVRVVVGDLRLFRETFPDIVKDKLFLPTLILRLGRWGVTALVVDTDEGRPDRAAASAFNGELRSLVTGQLYTWRVPFFGENRVAIAAIPPMIPGAAGIVRELEVRKREREGAPWQLRVNPHFELYSGIEEGKPSAVPLQVLLYEETKAFQEYVAAENALFSRLFSGQHGLGAPVIEVRSTKDYDGLRDFCQLPSETKLPHTLVFVVDGYWGLSKRGALRSQEEYLHGPIWLGGKSAVEFQREYADFVDILHLYRETRYPGAPPPDSFTRRFRRYLRDRNYPRDIDFRHDGSKDDGRTCRWLYYRQTRECGDRESSPAANPASISDDSIAASLPPAARTPYYYLPRFWKPKGHNRVPFTWDFGFLLCNLREWKNASGLSLKRLFTPADEGRKDSVQPTVGDVWAALHRVEPSTEQEDAAQPVDLSLNCGLKFHSPAGLSFSSDVRSWRYFFDAAKQVAMVEERRTGNRSIAFDLAMMAPDSLSCLWLEIWASEIVRTNRRLRQMRDAVSPQLQERIDARIHESEDILQRFSTIRFNPDQYRDISEWLRPLKFQEGTPKTAKAAFRSRRRASPHSGNPIEDGMEALLEFPGFTLEMYKVWLLLIEVLAVETYSDPADPFQLALDRPPQIGAVSARHWYKTACLVCEADEKQYGNDAVVTRVPMRLPGHFSVRGDWYLAVAQGSRSNRLADLALDMLTSRKANRTRLHGGLGLPTRDLAEGRNAHFLRTRLTVSTPDRISHVLYGDLVELGGDYVHPDQEGRPIRCEEDEFRWFFRSAFADYDRQAAALRKWIGRVLQWTRQYRHDNRKDWHGGFRAYDEIDWGHFETAKDYDSFEALAEYIDRLSDDLLQCRMDRTRDGAGETA